MEIASSDKRKQLEQFVEGAAKITPELEEKEFAENGNWENVTGHCLLEAARACVFAGMFKFDAGLTKDLALAALLHDGYKKQEMEAIKLEIKNGGSGRAASNAEAKKYFEGLRGKGMRERVLRLMSFAGGMPEVLFAAKEILDHTPLTDEDAAALVIQYIDTYTRGDLWAEPLSGEMNEVDRRVGRNRNNPAYRKIGEEIDGILKGNKFFSGTDSFGAMAALSHKIEEKFSELIAEKSGMRIRPLDLPEEIDKNIKRSLLA